MTLKHFIDRPVLAAVISIVIVLGGIIGVATLPVEQYPDIAPPTVMVRASYPGASAETIQKSVIIPLEEAINGVENMMYIKSEASNAGSGSITVYFKQGTDAGHGRRQCAEQSSDGNRIAPGRGYQNRCDDHEAPVFDVGSLHPLQPRQFLRRVVPLQLYEHQYQAPDTPYSGRG